MLNTFFLFVWKTKTKNTKKTRAYDSLKLRNFILKHLRYSLLIEDTSLGLFAIPTALWSISSLELATQHMPLRKHRRWWLIFVGGGGGCFSLISWHNNYGFSFFLYSIFSPQCLPNATTKIPVSLRTKNAFEC